MPVSKPEKLYLVDLAGSEKVERQGSSLGVTLDEAKISILVSLVLKVYSFTR
jgi:hypothetical protein